MNCWRYSFVFRRVNLLAFFPLSDKLSVDSNKSEVQIRKQMKAEMFFDIVRANPFRQMNKL